MLKAALLLVFLGSAHEASAQVQGMTWSIDQPCGRAIVVGASVMGVRPKSEHATCAPHLECPRAPRLTATENRPAQITTVAGTATIDTGDPLAPQVSLMNAPSGAAARANGQIMFEATAGVRCTHVVRVLPFQEQF